MKTAGSILKEARIEKKLTLDQAEQATKIRRKFLLAIEADDYSSMPSIAYAKGFVKNYSGYLGLDSNLVLAFFRRQNAEVSKSSLLPHGVAEPLNESLFHLTPSRFIAIIIGFLIFSFLTYFGLQYRRIILPPKLTIEAPLDGMKVKDKRIDVFGTTDSDATVTINGVSTLVRTDGKFFDRVALDPGTNTVTISAISRYGKSRSVKEKVIYQP
jgi:cytoskeletal protein RodZ